ncbi:acylphosphatase [Lactococcus garvieae]|jgi:acylphosphatase|uniref:acylphosphatase n=1 Tax=Lactococcus garvieae DCC43 TaxID=1231377 RepID=K2QAU9_9LACT|nr:acylphosphatase [Lactococcus garvieae]EKF50592.1 Acylphosphate phosphohydrolase, putative [Lactococcus garvieae DCC43]QPS70358.1 acylphosphatase [Lactococcus garvieae]
MHKVKMIVHGQVQGVGFRYSTVLIARELGIKGRVWNNADGTVGLLAQSDSQAALKSFEMKLRQGPTPFASVSKLDISTTDFSDFKNFDIKY